MTKKLTGKIHHHNLDSWIETADGKKAYLDLTLCNEHFIKQPTIARNEVISFDNRNYIPYITNRMERYAFRATEDISFIARYADKYDNIPAHMKYWYVVEEILENSDPPLSKKMKVTPKPSTPDTSTIDKLFLELSQFTQATTGKEIAYQTRIIALLDIIEKLEGGKEELKREYVRLKKE